MECNIREQKDARPREDALTAPTSNRFRDSFLLLQTYLSKRSVQSYAVHSLYKAAGVDAGEEKLGIPLRLACRPALLKDLDCIFSVCCDCYKYQHKGSVYKAAYIRRRGHQH